ncbi:hypothetical protein F8388_012604 [Cannabis sativa]|uniref:Uncharacterized protein n=1 Tax=Cannabis sativa TaxID=3483 RepID=A0A7J6HSG1_CANSA|nr:hypothetical protein F8388_012604 [Cannabis sativa]KAF4398222.1 hypothetical protein G4B88_009838 [Cannabis sativa]
MNAYSVSRTNSHFVSLASWSATAEGSNKNIEIKHPRNISFGTTEFLYRCVFDVNEQLELAQSVKDSSNCQVKIRMKISIGNINRMDVLNPQLFLKSLVVPRRYKLMALQL